MVGFPENTMLAVRKAVEVGYKLVELDVARTKDNVYVVHHDATIDRCSNGEGNLDNYTFEELKSFDFGEGEKLPSLEEMLSLCRNLQVAVEIDLSNRHIISPDDFLPIYNIVKNADMLSNVLFCITPDRIPHFVSLNSSNVSVALNASTYKQELIDNIMNTKDKFNLLFIDMYYKDVTQGRIDYVHSFGAKINAYTCNDEQIAKTLLDSGVDYILTETILPEILNK